MCSFVIVDGCLILMGLAVCILSDFWQLVYERFCQDAVCWRSVQHIVLDGSATYNDSIHVMYCQRFPRLFVCFISGVILSEFSTKGY